MNRRPTLVRENELYNSEYLAPLRYEEEEDTGYFYNPMGVRSLQLLASDMIPSRYLREFPDGVSRPEAAERIQRGYSDFRRNRRDRRRREGGCDRVLYNPDSHNKSKIAKCIKDFVENFVSINGTDQLDLFTSPLLSYVEDSDLPQGMEYYRIYEIPPEEQWQITKRVLPGMTKRDLIEYIDSNISLYIRETNEYY